MNAMMKLKAEIERTLGLPEGSMEIRDHEGRAMVCYRPTPTLPSLIEIEIYRSVLDEGAWQVAAIRDSISNHYWEDLKGLRVMEKS